MTEVYINQQRVFFKEDTKLKLTIENTFFEDAGSYTLEVVFPLDIEQNRKVFGVINRMEVTKRYQKYEALITVDSKLVFKGTAKITNISETEVKLQFLSGNSNVKFWTKAQKLYIDEFEYEYTDNRSSFEQYKGLDYGVTSMSLIKAGTFPGKKGIFCYVPIYDENSTLVHAPGVVGLLNEHQLMMNHDEWVLRSRGYETDPGNYYVALLRESISPNLMFVTRWIFEHLGYTIRRNDRDTAFVNSIYIATARRTTRKSNGTNVISSHTEKAMAKALPHWTVEEFVKQLQNFLNVTVIFDDITGCVDIISDVYTDGTKDITKSVEDEYEVEIIDEEDVESNLYDSNVKYKKGTSNYHNIDIVDREIIDSFTEVKCRYEDFLRQWDSMSSDEKKKTIWTTEKGQFCAKITNSGNSETLERLRINHFGDIIRNADNDNDIELKISPVATTKEIEMYVFDYYVSGGNIARNSFGHISTCTQTVLCLQNQYEEANKSTVWDALQGTQEQESEKEDIMQVFLMDDKSIPSSFYSVPFQVPFTHWAYNKPQGNTEHSHYSLSLTNDESWHNIGELHQSARNQNRNAEHHFKFTAESIPSVYNIYLLRNKKYVCKKLEVQFNSKGMENEITGYFEEILE